MTSLWQAVVLGVVQGLAEWLPISSPAHLALAGRAMGTDLPAALHLMLQLGTLAAAVVAFRARLRAMAVAFARGLRAPVRAWRASADFRLALLLAVATLPAAFARLVLQEAVAAGVSSQAMLAAGLLWTGAVLASTHLARPRHALEKAGVMEAAAVGLAQSLAIAPGVSRSGMALSAGAHMGLDRPAAVEFAFLLAIPALVGSILLKAPALASLGAVGWGAVAAGTLAAFVTGILGLGFLLSWAGRRGLLPFAAYDVALGGVLLGASLA